MAKAAVATGRRIVSGERPAHLAKTGGAGGPGRARVPTEFDDMVQDWYKSGEWQYISAEGDTDEAKQEDFEEIFKAVKRAADHHKLGIERLKDEENLVVCVLIRDKTTRGPKIGSVKDPETGKLVSPDDPRYDEVVAAKRGDRDPAAVPESDMEF